MATTFDKHAQSYRESLDQGLSLTGENSAYFAQRRIEWLSHKLKRLNASPQTVLDFGCGVGSSVSHFRRLIAPRLIVGLDVSPKSIVCAREVWNSENVQFSLVTDYKPSESFDLVFTNGVFHHIPVSERSVALSLVKQSLKPGGIFAFWENNSLNPGTRYVMARLPFDRDAVPITAGRARRMLSAAGFEIIDVSFMFIFPRALKFLRSFEPVLSRAPLGGQYQILCRRK